MQKEDNEKKTERERERERPKHTYKHSVISILRQRMENSSLFFQFLFKQSHYLFWRHLRTCACCYSIHWIDFPLCRLPHLSSSLAHSLSRIYLQSYFIFLYRFRFIFSTRQVFHSLAVKLLSLSCNWTHWNTHTYTHTFINSHPKR